MFFGQPLNAKKISRFGFNRIHTNIIDSRVHADFGENRQKGKAQNDVSIADKRAEFFGTAGQNHWSNSCQSVCQVLSIDPASEDIFTKMSKNMLISSNFPCCQNHLLFYAVSMHS